MRGAPHRCAPFVFPALLVLLLPAPGPQASVARRTLNGLGREASLIVEGKVAETRFARNADESLIYTFVTLDVSRVIKGKPPSRRLRFRVMGGRIGDLGLIVPEAPVFEAGEEVIVLLSPDDEGFLAVEGWFQGAFPIDKGRVRGTSISADTLAGVLAGTIPETEAATLCSITCDPTSSPVLRWPQPAMGKPYLVNPAPMDGCTTGDWLNAVWGAADTWSLANANFYFTYGGLTDLTNRGKQPDGYNVISVARASSALAYTTLWFVFSTGTLIENDMVLSVDKNSIHWSCDPFPMPERYDVRSAVTHEFGHFLFLDDITESGCRSLTMYGAQFWNSTEPRSLEPPDVCGIQRLYP